MGWGTLWIPGLGGGDVLGDTERLLAATRTAAVTTGVVSIWRHDARQMAAGHHRLQADYGRRMLLGLGVSDPATAHRAGRPFHPVADMNDYLDRLDQTETRVPPQERLLAALGPRLVHLAGERTAGVHSFLVTPEATAATRQLLGPTPMLAPYQAVVLDQNPDTAHAAARAFISPFLGMAHYARSLRSQGFTDDDLARGGSDRLIDAVVAWGDVEVIAKRVQAQHDAGADHVTLHVLSSDAAFPSQAWRELAPLTR